MFNRNKICNQSVRVLSLVHFLNNNKQLLDLVFVISRIINVEVSGMLSAEAEGGG